MCDIPKCLNKPYKFIKEFNYDNNYFLLYQAVFVGFISTYTIYIKHYKKLCQNLL